MKNPNQIVHECQKREEPVFVLRAKDRASVVALEAYYLMVSEAGCNAEFAEEVRQIANNFHLWQAQNRDKTRIPD